MFKSKFLIVVLFLFSFVMLTGSLAFAERDCTHQVDRSGGTKAITIDCSSSSTDTSENFTNRYLFSTLLSNMEDNIRSSYQNLQDRLAAIFLNQEHSKQITANLREKEQEALENQQIKHQEQEDQLESLKERQAMQKQQQQDLMHGLNER